MPVIGSQTGNNYGDFYAVNGPWIDPTSQEELETLLKHIRTHIPRVNVIYDDPDSSEASIDWRLIRDSLLPAADDWVNGQLRHRYAVPLRKTANGGTSYDMNIVALASLYLAHRLETGVFAGSAMPSQSEYGNLLESLRDGLLSDIKAMRLAGQRRKANHRTYDPNMEPTEQPTQGGSQNKGAFQVKQNDPPDV